MKLKVTEISEVEVLAEKRHTYVYWWVWMNLKYLVAWDDIMVNQKVRDHEINGEVGFDQYKTDDSKSDFWKLACLGI